MKIWWGDEPNKPEESLGRCVFFCFQLVHNEGLQDSRVGRRGELAVANFLKFVLLA